VVGATVRVVVQRVARASVTVDGREVGAVERGLVVLVGIASGDGDEAVAWMADKVAGLRVFPDDDGKMNRSLLEIGGGALVVSQFTLYGDATRGRRPSFIDAAPPEAAEPIYQRFVEALRGRGVPVATGVFGATMAISLVNDGPVTLVIER
jgi:D-tyrosyl-tRNA(Tyr) deacylase